MSECGCVYVEVDCPPDLYKATIRTAAKEHQCGECGKPISIGSKYEYVAATWEGEFGVCKTCAICLEIREEFFCDGFSHGSVLEDLGMYIQEVETLPEDCIAGLSEKAREIVCDLIQGQWED